MAQVHFTAWLRDLVPAGPMQAKGGTVGEALATVFVELPHLQGYVLDDRGNLRRHVCVFADGQRLARDATLRHPVRPDSQVYVMQALSGG
jgi:molybdopterin synthase sulfur carrier subunit